MKISQQRYLQNVLNVLDEIERLLLYSLEKDKIEYRIVITKKSNIDPHEEWRIVKQLVKIGVVTEYEESETYKAQVNNTILDPVVAFFLNVDPQKIKLHYETIKQQLKSEEFEDLESFQWPRTYKWISRKEYQAKNKIIFSDNGSNRLMIFQELIKEEGSWVLSKHLLVLLSIKTNENLRSHISELKKKLLGSGLFIEARKDRNKQSAYRIVPLS